MLLGIRGPLGPRAKNGLWVNMPSNYMMVSRFETFNDKCMRAHVGLSRHYGPS